MTAVRKIAAFPEALRAALTELAPQWLPDR